MELKLFYTEESGMSTVFTFFPCPCRCGGYGNKFAMESDVFEEEHGMFMEYKGDDEFNPIKMANDLLKAFDEFTWTLADVRLFAVEDVEMEETGKGMLN